MACKHCGKSFRTIHLEKGERMICYKCGQGNGIKKTYQGTPGLNSDGEIIKSA